MASRYPKQEAEVRARFERLAPTLTERGRRLFAANEAAQIGYGGETAVSRATGLAVSTIRRGLEELADVERLELPDGRQRRAGGGRKKVEEVYPGIIGVLLELVDSSTRGDPESPLRWTSKSLGKLAGELTERGYPVNASTVRRLLVEQGFTLQNTKKTLNGSSHADRNAQFEHLHELMVRFQAEGQPVISVDTKEKELVGDYQNGGQEWHPKGEGPDVLVHDFPNGEPKAVPYGVYDVARNEGFVNVGVSSDTAEFATATIERWWDTMGRDRYPEATDLLITADCGGSNGYRVRLWRLALQGLADRTGLAITVVHLPPGTRKWNKIEHRLFSFISMSWRGRPLVSYETIVQLIASTRTNKGLTVRCELDEGEYLKGRKVSDADLDAVNIERDAFHGEWNYTVYPTAPPPGTPD